MKHSLLVPFLRLITVLFILLIPGSAPASDPIQVVEATGASLKPLIGQSVSSLHLGIYKNSQWFPIPYQIDEKVYDPLSKSRRWALDHLFSRRADLLPGDGKIEGDEAILWMYKDMGDKIPGPVSAEKPYLEWSVGGRFVYILMDSKESQTSHQSYLQYNPDLDLVEAPGYRNRFNLQTPALLEELIPKNPGSGPPLNILEGFKVRVLLAVKNFFDVRVRENEITSRKVGYRLGPIRMIRRISAYKSLGPIRVTPKTESDYLFYPYHVQIPSRVDNPVDGKKYFEEKSNGFAGFDFSKAFYGARFYSEKNPHPVVLDGTYSAEEKNLVTHDVNWWVVQGEKGVMAIKVRWDPALTQAGVLGDLYYQDGELHPGTTEAEAGKTVIGFQLHPARIPAGHFLITLEQVFPLQRVAPGSEKMILNPVLTPTVNLLISQ